MKKYILLFFLISILASCSQHGGGNYSCEKVKVVENFPKEMELKQTAPEKIDLTGCLDVFSVDSLLICKMGAGDYFWKVYSLNTNKLLVKLLRRGHGENEFTQLVSSEQGIKRDSALFCDFWCPERRMWMRCNLTESINKQQFVLEKQKKILPKSEVSDIFSLNDSAFFVVSTNHYRGFTRYLLKDEKFSEVENLGNLNSFMADELTTLSAGACVNSRKGKVAEAMIRLNQINLYSLKNGESVTLAMGTDLQNVKSIEQRPKKLRNKYFGPIRSDNEKFAVLYYDSSLWNYFNGLSKQTKLLYFDWDGNPLRCITIPYQVSNFFTYNHFLYLFASGGTSEQLFKYKLDE